MSLHDFDRVESAREMGDGVHPAPPGGYDEIGDFRVRVVFQSECEARLTHPTDSLRSALHFADQERARLSKPWREAGRNPAAHVFVDVIDMDDPERGSLDWENLDG